MITEEILKELVQIDRCLFEKEFKGAVIKKLKELGVEEISAHIKACVFWVAYKKGGIINLYQEYCMGMTLNEDYQKQNKECILHVINNKGG